MRDWSEPRRALLAWYDVHARDLPWRRTRDPYAIWVSEIMLQQTRVETVIPYYGRFLERFPSAQALAEAPLDDVLAAWSGLGYYRRARMLHAGAQAVVRDHAGELPREPLLRRALPGIGAYTAGAIGSIAFGLPEPIVDGNVARVLARVLCIDTPLGDRVTERTLWHEAEQLAQGERPGDLNQALMELGARVCTPVNARCGGCPLREGCAARAADRVDDLPVPTKKKPPKPVQLVALVAESRAGELWLTRSEGSLFGGLWGCPLDEGKGVATAETLATRAGLVGKLSRKLGAVTHVLTHRRLTLDVYRLDQAEGAEHAGLKRLLPSALGTLGVAKLTHKLLAAAARPTVSTLPGT
jgi:A/G-specific adenine glycosylase